MTTLLLPLSLPEHERSADYDFDTRNDIIVITPETPKEPHPTTQSKGDISICRAELFIIRLPILNLEKEKLSHWGVYFSKVEQNENEVSSVSQVNTMFANSCVKEPEWFVLVISFNDARNNLMLETVWHTPTEERKYNKYIRTTKIIRTIED